MPHPLRAGLSLLVLFIGLMGGPSAALAQGLTVETAAAEGLTASTSGPTTFSLSVSAATGGTYELVPELPDGWRSMIMGGRQFALEPEQRAQRLVTFFVPRAVTAGAYRLVYRVRRVVKDLPARESSAQDNADRGAVVVVPVMVPGYRALRLEAVGDRPPFLVAGTAYAFPYRLHNASNVVSQVRLYIDGSTRRSAPDSLRLELAPGEVRDLTVDVQTQDVAYQYSHALHLRAVTVDTVEANLRARIDVYPRVADGRLRYHRFPLVVEGGASAVTSDAATATYYQFKATGRGPLAPGSDTELHFTLQGPGSSSRPALYRFASRDRYRAQLSNDRLLVRAGDQSMQSVGVAPNASGFGADLRYDFGGMEAQAFYLWSRQPFETGYDRGARLGVGNAQTFLRAGYQESTGFRAGRTWASEAAWRPIRPVRIRASGAASSSVAGRGIGYDVSAAYQGGRVGLAVEHDAADPAFLGINRGTTFSSGSAYFNPWGPWVLRGRYSRSSRRVSQREFVRGALSAGPRVTLYYEGNGRRRAGSGGARLQSWTDAVGASWSLRNRVVGLGGQAEVQRPRGLQSHRALSATVRLRGQWRPAAGVQLGLSAAYRNRRPVFSTARTTQQTGAVQVATQLTARLRAGLNASVTEFAGSRFRSYSGRGMAELEYALPSGTTLRLTGVGRLFGDRFTHGVGLTLTQPIGAPLSRDRTTGLVRGELVDGATGQGLADVPVRIADAAVLTDKNGSFVVPRLPTGDYPLTVDAQALPRGHIVAQGLPYTVSVRGGKVAVVRLSTREAASISGEVLREVGDTIERETEREEEAKERVPMEGVVVEITGTTQEGRDVYQRRLTDSNGAFRLLGLVAGRYQARVLPGSLPELHTATPATQTIELRDGAAEDVTFVVRPVKRKIQFLKVGGSH